ncbi:phage tail protein [Pseudoalteromonas rubra]|uniref:phage tail-collar fiber domain-containing protein n=1 Tax=Pseudoalteromonas rubra TaxID=43658 RepID=UPI002DBC8A27|nr:phage tail protein [Pseudoalteromonas rubra]MEC4090563.1 phage tail protein [Pseudoalteromonas rubra]
MSILLQPVITSAGLSALFRAQQDGFKAKISKVGLGSGSYQPHEGITRLQDEKYKLDLASAKTLADGKQLHLTVRDAEPIAGEGFFVNEIGFYTEEEVDGQIQHVLFAVYSSPTESIAYKSNDVELLLAFDLTLTGVPSDSITVIDQGVEFNILVAPELAKMGKAQIGNMHRHLKLKFALMDNGVL